MRARALVLAIALAGCGGPAAAPRAPVPAPPPTSPAPTAPVEPAPAPPADPLAGQVEAMVRGYQTIAGAAGPEAACPAIARTIASVAASTADARAAVRTASRGERAEDVDALLTAAEPRLGPAVATLDAAAGRCGADAEVAHALDALDR